jgi:hypothetical protein
MLWIPELAIRTMSRANPISKRKTPRQALAFRSDYPCSEALDSHRVQPAVAADAAAGAAGAAP